MIEEIGNGGGGLQCPGGIIKLASSVMNCGINTKIKLKLLNNRELLLFRS